MSDAGVSKALAEFCANFRYEDLPPEVVSETKRIILDGIGCGLGGYSVDKGRLSVELARRSGGVAEATIVGTAGKVPAAQAAFANGELMNALDWCPVQSPAHVVAFVLPPVMAMAEAHGKSGRDLIAATALAMEVTGRLGAATGGLRSPNGGIPRRVWGLSSNVVGGAAGVGNLLGFDAGRMLHALGTAGYYAPVATHTKYLYTHELGYAKYGPSGWMAQGAVTSAQLAELGYHGDTTFLEGEYGFSVQNGAESWQPEKLLGRLGRTWTMLNVGFKPYPTCGIFQSSLQVLKALLDMHDLRPEEIERIDFNVEPMGLLPSFIADEPKDHVEAAASAPYAVAVLCHRIKRGPGWQAQSVIDDPRIRAFMKKVRIGLNPRVEVLRHQDITVEGRPYPRHRPGSCAVTARGQVFEGASDFCPWLSIDPDWSASDADLASKFRENADSVLSLGKIEAAIETILALDQLGNVSALLATLAG